RRTTQNCRRAGACVLRKLGDVVDAVLRVVGTGLVEVRAVNDLQRLEALHHEPPYQFPGQPRRQAPCVPVGVGTSKIGSIGVATSLSRRRSFMSSAARIATSGGTDASYSGAISIARL